MNNEQEKDKDKKTNEDFPGHPNYPAKDKMLKKDHEEELNADEKSFTGPATGKKEDDLPYKKGDVLRGEMDKESDQLPGKKSDEKDEGDL
jgi:hypothetical protein